MYTKFENRRPGKFEGNHSQLLARVVYNVALDGCNDQTGDSSFGEWYGLILGKKYGFIVRENSMGFADVFVYPNWDAAQGEYFDIASNIFYQDESNEW